MTACGFCGDCLMKSLAFIQDVEAAVWKVSNGDFKVYHFLMADLLDGFEYAGNEDRPC